MNILFTILFLGVALTGLAIGIIFNNKPLQGSCGGSGKECVCLSGDVCEYKNENSKGKI
ncbi:MAG: hypothetical protein V3S48_00915 [Candidatus Neomarinimicrobiota bacterium]